jgi:hypothetical protein
VQQAGFPEPSRGPRLSIIVSNESAERVVRGIRILPWRVFFEELWGGQIIGG